MVRPRDLSFTAPRSTGVLVIEIETVLSGDLLQVWLESKLKQLADDLTESV